METTQKGRRRLPIKSIRFRIVFLVFSAISILLLILFFNNIYAIDVVRKQVFETNSRMLTLYMSQIDNAFEDVENYLAGLQSSSNLSTIEWTDNEIDYYTAQSRLKQDMENAIPSYGFIEDLFVYFSEEESYMDAAKYNLSGAERTAIKNMVMETVEQKLNQKESGKWIGIEVDGEYYLIRILRVRQTYMGGYVKVSTLVNKLREDGFGEMEHLALCLNSGQELGSSLPKLKESIRIDKDQNYYSMVGEDTKYMMLAASSDCGDYSLVAMIRDNNILEGLGSVQKLISALFVCLLLFLIMFVIVVRRWLIKPLDDLTDAMRSLSKGDLDVRLTANVDCEEFSVVNKTFDDMIEQIQLLKIDVYEEKVQRQKAELQYMKLQVNPHFYINCLNVIHNLSIMNRNQLVQEMTTYLGNHLRYTMEGNSVDCLRKEIDYVKNYLQIQELRFAHSFQCHFDIEDVVQNVLVPPLIIQTFVENTVKYQVVTGELTEMFIEAKPDVNPSKDYIRIEIWDTGDGFSDYILECLNKDLRIFDDKGEHFGIHNVQQRLKLIYQGEEKISFSNHPVTGGAYIVICLPDDKGAGGK